MRRYKNGIRNKVREKTYWSIPPAEATRWASFIPVILEKLLPIPGLTIADNIDLKLGWWIVSEQVRQDLSHRRIHRSWLMILSYL